MVVDNVDYNIECWAVVDNLGCNIVLGGRRSSGVQ